MTISTAVDAGVLSPGLPWSRTSPRDFRSGTGGADAVSDRLDRRRVPTQRRHYRARRTRDMIRTAAAVELRALRGPV